jgi:hypothetical protein
MRRLEYLVTDCTRAMTAPPVMLIALILMVTTGFAAPADASTIPISGTFAGDSTLTATSTPGIYVQNFSGNGDDTTYGSFTTGSMSTVDFSKPPNIIISDGLFTETFSQGTLFGTSSGNGSASGKGTATFTIDYVFTGGTRLFAGDTGEATLTGTITSTSPTTESITGSYSGSLTATPVPAALPLFVGGLGMIGLLGQRRIRKNAAAAA